MLWQQILLTFWPGVEFQLLRAGDGFSSLVIRIPLSCSGHMKPGWWEASLPSCPAAHCLAHCTCLSGELSSFFNAFLPAASSVWQGGSCAMDVQSQRSVSEGTARATGVLPNTLRNAGLGAARVQCWAQPLRCHTLLLLSPSKDVWGL